MPRVRDNTTSARHLRKNVSTSNGFPPRSSSKPHSLTTRKRLSDRPHPLFFSRHPQAGAAGAPVLGPAGTLRVGTVMADEPTILIGDHLSEVSTFHAIWAADGQDCVDENWHRARTPHRVIGTQASETKRSYSAENHKDPFLSLVLSVASTAVSLRQR
jgi:hypothetical protein